MRIRNLVLGMAAGMMLLGAASAVSAATITSADGVLSIETPSDAWTQKTDSKALLEITDGKNSIAIEHLSNGEALPVQQVADEKNPDVYVSLISTKNEVFSVKGLAVDNANLQSVIQTAGTIKILKFDTKTAVTPAATETKKAENTATATPAPQAAESSETVTVYDEGGMSVELYYDAATGDYHDSNGNVFKPMAGSVYYQPESNAYWSADPNYFKEHDASELNYQEFEEMKNGTRESLTVFDENGDSRVLHYDSDDGNYKDDSGLVYLPMAGSMHYQPDTDTYWSGDASYWDNYSAEDMNYDEFAEEAYGAEADTYNEGEEEYVEDEDEGEYYEEGDEYYDDYSEEVYE